MTYTIKERRDDDGTLFIAFHFSNGKTVELKASDYASGAAMIKAAEEQAA